MALGSFDREKAVEVLLYAAESLTRRNREAGFHKLSKICYFADREHLSRYGRLIMNDDYVAMKHGPVPSHTYNLMKKDRFSGSDVLTEDAYRIDGHNVVPLRAADLDEFSGSELKCLDSAIERYGAMSFGQLTRVSHDAAWDKADENDQMALADIIDTLDDAEDIKAHLFGAA